MKKVINRKLYDTETAEKIAEFTLDTHPEIQEHLKKVLYKTDNGAYFLYRESFVGDCYGEKTIVKDPFDKEILALDEEDAVDWAEDRAISGEVIMDEFGEHIESA